MARRWDKSDVSFLKKKFSSNSNFDLACDLERSEASVRNKANELGLMKSQRYLKEMRRGF